MGWKIRSENLDRSASTPTVKSLGAASAKACHDSHMSNSKGFDIITTCAFLDSSSNHQRISKRFYKPPPVLYAASILRLECLERLEDGAVSGLLNEVLVPRKSIAKASKDLRHPGVLVSPVPDGDANTLVDSKAGSGRVVVSIGLQAVDGVVGGDRNTDVKLGVSNIDAERSIALDGGNLGVVAGHAVELEVGLHADAIDLCAVLLDQLDDVLRCGDLGARPLQVVVVVVKLG